MNWSQREQFRSTIKTVLGKRLGNWCLRHDIWSFEDLDAYVKKHPYGKTVATACYWREIGPVGYREIVKALKAKGY